MIVANSRATRVPESDVSATKARHSRVQLAEDADLHARRLVAQRCLYGVDRNPMAVDLARLSLWLADLAFEDRKNWLDADELASRAATSVRTVSRVFPAETGLTLKSWRQRARIVQAMDWLARGHAIAHVSVEFGFASTASFSCAFRQVTAMTPTMFLSHQG